MKDYRRQIILDYAKWTALSALRSGTPAGFKARKDVYPQLDKIAFSDVLSSHRAISASEFNAWHERETEALCARVPINPRLPTGWSVKVINIFLKTTAYVGDIGRPGLREALHPPIDGGLWEGIEARFTRRSDILDAALHVRRIKDIATYPIYRTIIEGCRAAAKELKCDLIEVEQLWRGAATPSDHDLN